MQYREKSCLNGLGFFLLTLRQSSACHYLIGFFHQVFLDKLRIDQTATINPNDQGFKEDFDPQ